MPAWGGLPGTSPSAATGQHSRPASGAVSLPQEKEGHSLSVPLAPRELRGEEAPSQRRAQRNESPTAAA